MVLHAQPAGTVVLTDYAWPDLEIEHRIIEGAGYTLIAGDSEPAPEARIDELILQHNPVAVMTCWARVSAKAIGASPDLKIVARMGVGLDNIAVEAATRRGAWVTNVPDYCVEEVSDHAVGMALAWTRGLIQFDRDVRQGNWNPAAARLRRLATLTCGIVGYGRIGHRTAAKLKAFDVRLLTQARSGKTSDGGIELVELDDLMRLSDIVIVHVPLNGETRHLIDARRLALMKPGSMLINVSRGGVVDTEAVIGALESGRLAAAGLDVLEDEPKVPEALKAQPGAILTPHVAFSSDASLLELRVRACEDVVRALRGEPVHFPCNDPAARQG